MAAAGRLAATVAHEINNPLESIVNLIFLSRNSEGLPPGVAEYLKTADEELVRIAQIVRQTLGFYRESVGPRHTDVATVAGETVEVYRARITAKSLECVTELEPGLNAFVVPGELKQVIANLIANAISMRPELRRASCSIAVATQSDARQRSAWQTRAPALTLKTCPMCLSRSSPPRATWARDWDYG